MKLTGTKIQHITYGRGCVTDVKDHIISVRFPQGEKNFLFPDSFARYLTSEDAQIQKQIEATIRQREAEAQKENEAMREKELRMQRLRNLKISPNSHAVFGLVENTSQQVFASWSVLTGRYLSGYSKGEPRVPSRLKPNSSCLLTELSAGAPEKERKIIGAFMVPDDFDGALCAEGRIPSHADFRMKLPEHARLPFWDYFNVGTCPPNWGKTEIKYCSNLIAQRILLDIKKAVAGSPEQQAMDRFYQYFNQVNRLAPISIEEPEAEFPA